MNLLNKNYLIGIKRLNLLLTLIFCSFLNIHAQDNTEVEQYKHTLYNPSKDYLQSISGKTFFDFTKENESHYDTIKFKKGIGYKPFKRMEYFWSNRIANNGDYPNLRKIYDEAQEFLLAQKKLQNPLQATAKWRFIGVNNVPPFVNGMGGTGIGRVNFVAPHPTDPKTVWVGASGGGLRKTADGGLTWKLFDQTEFMSIGTACISVSKSNPNVVYAATGDANGPSGLGAYYSVGVYKTTNNGNTWTLLPTPTGGNLEQSNRFLIFAMDVHPTNPNIVYIATNIGVFSSQTGGTTWNQISSGYCRDLILHPTDPNIIYGAFTQSSNTFKISKYSVSQKSWKDVTSITNCIRTRLAVHKNFPNVVYAINVNQNNGFRSVIKSVDAGETWVQTSPTVAIFNYLGIYVSQNSTYGQGSYDLAIAISPRSSDEIVIGGIHSWISSNSGASFTPITNGYYENVAAQYVHPDQHHLVFAGNRLYNANDGGVVYSDDFGVSWTNISSGLGNTEHTRLSVSATNSNIMLSGAQDNGTYSKSTNDWVFAVGGDGMDNAIDPTNPSIMYAASQQGNFVRSTDGGKTFSSMITSSTTGERAYWCAPMTIDPNNASTLYVGFQNVWKSTNKGLNWAKISTLPTNANKTLTCLTVAPSNSQVIYTSFCDYSAPNYNSRSYLYKTINGGTTWEQVYVNNSYPITSIAIDSKNPARAFITLSGYGAGQKVFEINGTNATNISSNLPNLPINTIVYQKDSQDKLFIGNDMGVFTKDKNSSNWVAFGSDLPNVIVNDIEIHYGSGKMQIATYGRGVWEVDLFDCTLDSPELYKIGPNTLCSGDSLILETKNTYTSYEWSNGAKTRRIVVKNSGTYYVTVSDSKGCRATSETVDVNVGFITPLELDYDKSKLNLCEGDSLVVSAKGFYAKFDWSNGATGRKLVIKKAGTYYLTVTSNTSDCQAVSEKLVVTIKPAPAKPTIEKVGEKLVASIAMSYKWYFNSTLLPEVSTREYLPTKTGKYAVEVSNGNGCWSISDEFEYTPLGVYSDDFTNNLADEVSLKPNPNNGEFSVSLTQNLLNIFTDLQVVDLQGNIVFEKKIDEFENLTLKIDLSKCAVGSYYLLLKNTELTVSKVVVKQ